MVIYNNAGLYIEESTTIEGKIAAIEAIITALQVTAASAAGCDNITEYSLDDGQSKIRTVYRGVSQIIASINNFEKLKQMYINKLNGRVVRLVDSKSFIH
ncbi:MAG: hypothetical protein US15_C0012G0011 [Candidatus Moranbacteria bacterium GW2011_GWF1_36_4]|nr:MAG: hypothetical protein US15_C0012G0011 [Candidatus Moranbacteria bacterium GW2011_GWF1_36_4]